MRVLRGSDATILSPVFVAADGETPTDCDTDPTCTVVDHAGTALADAAVTATSTEDGAYTAQLTAADHTANLDRLTLTWTGEVAGATQTHTAEVDVAGGFYASLPSIRQMPGLTSPSDYPTERLREVREEFERLVDDYRGMAFVPRFAYETFRGCHWFSSYMLDEMFLRSVRAITVAGVAQDVAAWQLNDYGLLYNETAALSWSAGETATVAYEHGLDSPPPGLQRACREYVRAVLLKETSGVGRDVISQSFEGLVTRYSTPDPSAGRPTGWIEVDRLLNDLPDNRRIPVG